MSNFPLKVTAKPASPAMIAKGLYGRIEIDVIDGNGTAIVRLYEGLLKCTREGTWYVAPHQRTAGQDPQTGKNKYLSTWYLYPELKRDQRQALEQFILAQVFQQIPDPANPPAETAPQYQQAPATVPGMPAAPSQPAAPQAPAAPTAPQAPAAPPSMPSAIPGAPTTPPAPGGAPDTSFPWVNPPG